jgi:hypothetical protein
MGKPSSKNSIKAIIKNKGKRVKSNQKEISLFNITETNLGSDSNF